MRCVGHESGLNAELEEFKFTASSPYVGRTVREAEEENAHGGVMIVALRRANGEQMFNPKDDVIIAPAVSDDDAKERFPDGWEQPLPYVRIVPQPND